MITTAIDKMAEPIGFDLSQSSDEAQAALFNGLARGFRAMGEAKADPQITYMVQGFTPEARALVRLIARAAEYIDG